MLPFYAESLGADTVQIGMLMAAYSLFQIFSSPVWGGSSDRIGRKPILQVTILGQSIAFFIAALAQSFEVLHLSRAFAGMFGGNISVASAYVADATSEADRAKGMGLVGAAIGLGFVFGPVIGGLLIEYGVHWPSLIAAVLAALNLMAVTLFLKEPLKDISERASNRRRWSWNDVRENLSRIEILIPTLIFFFFTFAFVQLEVTFGLFVTQVFDYSKRDSGLMLGMVGLTMAAVQGGIVGRLSKRWSESKMILVGSLGLCAGLVLLAASQNSWQLFLALFILALGYSLANPCLSAAVSKAAGNRQGSVMGVYQSTGSLARVLAPITAGAVYGLSARYPMMLGAILVAGAAALWTARALIARASGN